MTPLRQRMIEDLRLRNRSPRTIEAYVAGVAKLAAFHRRSPEQLGPEDIRAFLVHLQEQRVSWSAYNQAVCGLRFLYGVTLGRTLDIARLPFAKRPRTLPSVLSREEVVQLLGAVSEPRYRLMLQVTYACGLRLSEVIGLKVADIDSGRMLVHVRQGKGQKDRLVPLSPRLLQALRLYWRHHRPADWLFPARGGTRPLCPGTLQRVCQEAVRRCGFRKQVSVHTLRHSYATHLVEAGVDLATVQKLLGHRDLKTTVRYTHLSVRRLQTTASLLDLIGIPRVAQDTAARPAAAATATLTSADKAEIHARLQRVCARAGKSQT